jgi:hypothetical protein
MTTNNYIINMAPPIQPEYASGKHVIKDNQMCGSPYATQLGWNTEWRKSPNTFSDNCTRAPWLSKLPPAPQRPF